MGNLRDRPDCIKAPIKASGIVECGVRRSMAQGYGLRRQLHTKPRWCKPPLFVDSPHTVRPRPAICTRAFMHTSAAVASAARAAAGTATAAAALRLALEP
eukprot:365421-Chlamydomonas_euryale.AAC.6